ncbi:hypothetical protein G6F63_015054 [Rhizopus arrhizus]|nr:hypothetical protein G6F63_015054 [Rhizopus arrhizus]
MVDLDQQQRQWAALLTDALQLRLAIGQYRAAVEQAGQAIGARRVPQVDQHALDQQQHHGEAARQLQHHPCNVGDEHRRAGAHDVLAGVGRHRQEQAHGIQRGFGQEHHRRPPAAGALLRRCLAQQQPGNPAIDDQP